MNTEKNKDVKAIVKEIQAAVEQMRLDDLENSPESAQEDFQCDCCGNVSKLAGSIIYNETLYCNDCVLLTETSLALKLIQTPEDMINAMEDKRFENVYNSIFSDDPTLI